MCGRTCCTISESTLKKISGAKRFQGAETYKKKFNCGPTMFLPCVHSNDKAISSTPAVSDVGASNMSSCGSEARALKAMKWGLKPSLGLSTINARSETVATSKLYGSLVDAKRCVVIIDGFYEWRTIGGQKSPFFIRNPVERRPFAIDDNAGSSPAGSPVHQLGKDLKEIDIKAEKIEIEGEVKVMPLLLAGLYCQEVEGGEYSMTILTMNATPPMAQLHDRQPVFLSPETAPLWLSDQPFAAIAPRVIRTSVVECKQLHIYEVAAECVNSVRNESPDCVLPKAELEKKKRASGIGKFFTKVADKTSGSSLVADKSKRAKIETITAEKAVVNAAIMSAVAKTEPKKEVAATSAQSVPIRKRKQSDAQMAPPPQEAQKKQQAKKTKGPLDNYFKRVKK